MSSKAFQVETDNDNQSYMINKKESPPAVSHMAFFPSHQNVIYFSYNQFSKCHGGDMTSVTDYWALLHVNK